MQVARRVAPEKPAAGRVSALSMYELPPAEPISVSEFEEFAYDRLRLLSTIELARAKGLKGAELEARIRKARDEFMPLSPTGLIKDYYSHFILRLAYCRSEDLRRWFLQNELELFKWRFVNNPPEDRAAWLRAKGLQYEAISRDEYEEIKEELHQALSSRRDLDPAAERSEHYKVAFEEVVDLVRQRRVYLRGGSAFVPAADLVSIVATAVRAQWSRRLATASHQWPALREEEADRLSSFLEGLATQYVGDDYSRPRSGSAVSLADLPTVSRRSFPLCMHNMHAKLLETKHLKHSARQQFGLFLKTIGLSCEESTAFFRAEFTKKGMAADKFMRDYGYGIRYNYGLEGKRQDWSAMSCGKIINSSGANAAAGEHHGCPFRNYDEGQMRATLQQMQVGAQDVQYILDKVRGQHYQVACGKFFEARHKGSTLIETDLGGINHPNQYFEESQKFFAPKDEAAAAGQAAAEPRTADVA
jgi:DNA primase large subunit